VRARPRGVPTFSPHGLRHRRVSLLHEAGWSTVRIAAYVGHEKLSMTSDVYTHVLGNRREAAYAEVLAAYLIGSGVPLQSAVAVAYCGRPVGR
jgi:integrase